MLLPAVAAQCQSHKNSCLATRWNKRCAPSWSGSSTLIPQLCAILALTYSNQIEWKMCSYLKWQLNPNPTTLCNSPTCVWQPDRIGDVLLPRVAAQCPQYQPRHCITFKLMSRITSPDLGLIHFNKFFTTLCECGHHFSCPVG
jgi:hypothetical protein